MNQKNKFSRSKSFSVLVPMLCVNAIKLSGRSAEMPILLKWFSTAPNPSYKIGISAGRSEKNRHKLNTYKMFQDCLK